MTPTRYANRIVMRRDTATGLVMAGYATEMPLERFEHLEDLCVTDDGAPLRAGNPCYEEYESACQRAYAANTPLIQRRAEQARGRGWIKVPLELSGDDAPDRFGSYRAAAMRALFNLCANVVDVWAVVDKNVVTHLQPRQPPRPMEALEHAVWKRYWLRKLGSYPGRVQEGRLVIDESGLWFCPAQSRGN